MVFSSSIFLLYFLPIFLLAYYIADKKFKNIIVLIFSIIFYAWGEPKFIFVILGTTFIDFHLVKLMAQTEKKTYRTLLLFLSVSVNLGLLFYFKYSNFFIENVNSFLSVFGDKNIHWTKLVLPLGISFYTFETITYVVDVYRKVHKPLTKFWDYQLYIILFPKLIAGPIIRYHDLADQISDRSQNETIDNKITGFYRFIIGLAKKVLIANSLGQAVDIIFSLPAAETGTLTAWVGIIAYSFQIYFDFSGYSDMCIGLGRMIGFKFPENFNNPYISQSISEFWRRWHISLGAWMKNYLYIPIGGNKVKSTSRLYFNLWFVFLISGLWHGAAWNFVVWGAFHGVFLILDRLILDKLFSKVGKFFRILFTYIVTLIGWVIFRAENLTYALQYIRNMFKVDGNLLPDYLDNRFWVFMIIGGIFAFIGIFKFGNKLENFFFSTKFNLKQTIFVGCVCVILFTICISFITKGGFNPFIYFRF